MSPVWPEPSSSAAGVRTACLVDALLAADWTVSYLRYQLASTCSEFGQGKMVEMLEIEISIPATPATILKGTKTALPAHICFVADPMRMLGA